MKKMIKLGIVSLLAIMVASCSSNNTEEVVDCPRVCPKSQMCDPKMDRKQCKENFKKCKENYAKWAKFDSLSEKEQKELIKKTKQSIDDREAKRKAYKDSIDALWNDFENLSIDQQKSLLKKKMWSCNRPGFGKPGCYKDGFCRYNKMKDCKKDFKRCSKRPKHHGKKPYGPRQDAQKNKF